MRSILSPRDITAAKFIMIVDPKFFISCDWGTTNFRLRLVHHKSLDIILRVEDDHGIRKHNQTYNNCRSSNREEFFWQHIRQHIDHFPIEHQQHPLVISGMASSNIGMKELPYADYPIKADGSSLIYHSLGRRLSSSNVLVSGVKSDHCMMRGEEVQAIGLSHVLHDNQTCVLILPGTHSKHITYCDGQYTSAKSYMTGERFDLMSTCSILSDSVTKGEWYHKDFSRGVIDGANHQVSDKLFSIRASHILHNINTDRNYCYLSGLLIGEELSNLLDEEFNIYLAAGASLSVPYQQALRAMNFSADQIHIINPSDVGSALIRGHQKILKLHANS